MDDQLHPNDPDAQLQVLLASLRPEEVLRHYQPEDVLRCYGLAELLRHLRDLNPAERDEVEVGLPPAVREALRAHVGTTPARYGDVEPGPGGPRVPLVHTRLSVLRGLEGFHDVVERVLSAFSPAAVLRACSPADVLRYYPFARLVCHLGNLLPAERARVEAGVAPALLEVLQTCAQDRELMRRLDARGARPITVERTHGTLPRDELVDALLRVLAPEEVLRRYSVEQLVSHLRERSELSPEVVEVLRGYVDGTP